MKNNKFENYNQVWTVILAAGKGTRMKAKNRNKVTYALKGKPMILRTISILKETGIENILIVVGFAKDSVIRLLTPDIKVVEQRKRLGTAHAVKVALRKIPQSAKYILVLQGDDSFLYSSQNITNLINKHIRSKSEISFITVELNNPYGLGRILRDKNNNVMGIIEEKDATQKQRQIHEVNTASYIFNRDFLDKYINKIPKSKVTGEYYLPVLTDIAIKNSEKVETVKLTNFKWRGVNTPEELQIAEKMIC